MFSSPFITAIDWYQRHNHKFKINLFLAKKILSTSWSKTIFPNPFHPDEPFASNKNICGALYLDLMIYLNSNCRTRSIRYKFEILHSYNEVKAELLREFIVILGYKSGVVLMWTNFHVISKLLHFICYVCVHCFHPF